MCTARRSSRLALPNLLALLAIAACADKDAAPGPPASAPAPGTSADTAVASAPAPDDRVKVLSAGFDPATGYNRAVLQGPPSTKAFHVHKLPLKKATYSHVTFDADGRASVAIGDTGKARFGIWLASEDALKGATVNGKAPPGALVELEATLVPRMRRSLDALECPKEVGACSVRRVPLAGWEVSGPEGFSVRIGHWELPLSSTKRVVPADDRAIAAALDLGAVAGKSGDFRDGAMVPVSVRQGEREVAAGTWKLSQTETGNLFVTLVAGIRQGPLAADPEGSGAAVLWVDNPDGPTDPHVRLLGEARHLGDVAIIALSKRFAGKQLACGSYAGGGASASVAVQAWGSEMVAYDRKTGRELGTRKFSPPARCPKQVYASKSAGAVSTGAWVDDDEIIGWIRSLSK